MASEDPEPNAGRFDVENTATRGPLHPISPASAGGAVGQGRTPVASARRLIEHLRSGVPLPPDEAPLITGRARLVARTADLLDTAAAKGSRAFAVQANYGDGKTHALRTIWHMAAERNFVVSHVALTRETPFDRLDRVYPKIIADTYVPGANQPGIERLVRRLGAGTEAANQVLRFAEDNLHPKVHAVVHNIIEGSSTEAVEPLVRDLAQLSMGTAELKRIHRGNFNNTLKLERFSAQRDARSYFRLVDALIGIAGYAGWVILFDEVELIGRLGRVGRAKAYGNVGRLAVDGMGCTRLVSVFAVASNFYDSILERRHDATQAADCLEVRGDPEGAECCRLGIAALQEAVLLPPLTPANWVQVMQTVLDAHEAAYAWSSGLTAPDFWQEVQRLSPETDTKIRTRLRLAIQWLDLHYQHGHAPQVRLATPKEVSLDEDAWDGAVSGDAAAAREEGEA